MNERDFAYWLNGFVEMNGGAMPTAAQWKAIQDHLALVFKKVTPPVVEVKSGESDLQRIMREFHERPRQVDQASPFQWPQQPYQWGPLGYPPGTIIC
jgi:hypothetical protein